MCAMWKKRRWLRDFTGQSASLSYNESSEKFLGGGWDFNVFQGF